MIRSKMAELRDRKAKKESRVLTVRIISAETGLSLGTVQRLLNGRFDRVYLGTLDVLCRYFQVIEIGELIEYVPDVQERKS